MLATCFLFACYIDNGAIRDVLKLPLLAIVLLSIIVWYVGARIFLLYGEITIFSFSQEMTVFLRQLVTHLLILTFILFVFYTQFYQFRSLLLYYHLLIFVTLPFEKYFYRVVVAYVRRQYKYEKNILIVGDGALASNFYRSDILHNDLKYNLVGILGDNDNKNFNSKYLGSINLLPEILDQKSIDEVFLALPGDAIEKTDYVIDVCEKRSCRVNVIQDINRLGAGSFEVTNFAGFPVVGIRYIPLDDAENRFFKRVFDIVFSALFLVLVYSWLWPIIALAIKLNSNGPILFKQERWGLNNDKIICYKFRTMYMPSTGEGSIGFKQASRNDKRVTAVGQFLRKTSLDELPQFINVFLGSMSVVGPRPHPIPLSLESKDLVQNYMLRHLVKPGITGWAQVNGSRGETSHPDDMRKRVAFDLWYIQNWSFWLDCQIIFQTIVNMIKGDENAY
ncbi:undecaprenyl-phosphate glucose phosphotransferase [Sediminibacterium roseum]|uniref:Undecaprenyl-phosphate glucose phosphotransferase n=1 Tax=Sediminibacterium roseum TaxID=1978412 RepID=A0ABW9ZRI6_9BACT|nr:undecaprenyl-phosphate glucose phosphotransferase [Sediminibacterium roseum]NCI49125.1 undecaprenyl-phosphate glucose phosphotransferase [Sediminibacterium roseum]